MKREWKAIPGHRGLQRCIAALAIILISVLSAPPAGAQRASQVPQYKVDPYWPKPLPTVKDEKGILRTWVTGEVGGSCIDSHNHIVTFNRGFIGRGVGALVMADGPTAIASPPVVIYDTDGNVVTSWGDPELLPNGSTKTMPGGVHGCFADHENNIWLAGHDDGIVQKWSHDGKLLLQIGTKGVCDGAPGTSKSVHSTCGSPGFNKSQESLNNPADIAVDPNPDPVTGQRGSVYVADGYGNFRVAVFDSEGKFLRQFGSRGNGPGQFGSPTGSGGYGHPHCVVLSKDGLVYTCDRTNSRIEVFDKVGNLKRTITVRPPEFAAMASLQSVTDITFSSDPEETYIFSTDIDTMRVWIVEKESGQIVGSFGRPGHQVGELNFPHTIVSDAQGNLYVSETVGGRRSQKFVKQ